jgi:hypothetical protein
MTEEARVFRRQEADDALHGRRLAFVRGVDPGSEELLIGSEPSEPSLQELAMAFAELESGQAMPYTAQSLELFIG